MHKARGWRALWVKHCGGKTASLALGWVCLRQHADDTGTNGCMQLRCKGLRCGKARDHRLSVTGQPSARQGGTPAPEYMHNQCTFKRDRVKLTAFTDYSLRVLIFLAADPDRRATIAEIAGAFDIKQNHLTKVVHFLGREGWVHTVRGKGGGLQLALAPDRIGIGAVVRQAEGADLPAECFDRTHNRCQITRICRLKGVLHEAVSAFHAVLDRYTLADLVHNRHALANLLLHA